MANLKLAYSNATSLTVTGLNSLANQSTATSDAVDNTTNLYLDYLVEVSIADVAEAGSNTVFVYAISSVDGTNYSDLQSTNLSAPAVVGAVPCRGAGTWRSRAMSVAAAFGGSLPPKFKLVIYNDLGVTLASSGNSVQYVGTYLTST